MELKNNAVILKLDGNNERAVLFPIARKVAERNRVTTTTKWKKYREEVLVAELKLNPGDDALMKVEQDKFMAEKERQRSLARMMGRELASSEVFNDITVDTWSDSKGRKQFAIRGKENADGSAPAALTIEQQITSMTPEALTALRKLISDTEKSKKSKPAPSQQAPINV